VPIAVPRWLREGRSQLGVQPSNDTRNAPTVTRYEAHLSPLAIKLVRWHALPVLPRVQCSGGGYTSLIIVKAGDPLRTVSLGCAGGRKGHD
jgi:hypothetical protein